MATIKSYTDISQSKKLATILPAESADMFYVAGKGEPIFIGNKMVAYGDDDYDALGGPDVLCWSLAALLDILPDNYIDVDDIIKHPSLIKTEGGHYMVIYSAFQYTSLYNNPIDACVAMIKKFNELKIL